MCYLVKDAWVNLMQRGLKRHDLYTSHMNWLLTVVAHLSCWRSTTSSVRWLFAFVVERVERCIVHSLFTNMYLCSQEEVVSDTTATTILYQTHRLVWKTNVHHYKAQNVDSILVHMNTSWCLNKVSLLYSSVSEAVLSTIERYQPLYSHNVLV